MRASANTSPIRSAKVMIILVLFLLLACQIISQAQQLPGDSLLAIERSIDRPVTLHARQLRLTGGYGLAIVSRRFDDVGNVFMLRDDGSSSLRHRLNFDVKYGLNDFVQLTAGISRTEQVIRGQTEYIFPQEQDPVVSHQIVNRHSGFEDLFVAVDLRAPLRTQKLDIALTLGASLPVARSQAQQPGHSFEIREVDGEPMHTFIYRYYYPQGKGITIGQIGGVIKYRMKRMAFSGRIDYQHGLTDASPVEWRHQFDPAEGFEYRVTRYTYRLPDSFSYFFEAEYQPRPWLDLFLNVSGFTAYRGWVSFDGDLKVAVPFETVGVCSPGVEILITPRLWLRERLDITLAGLNTQGTIGFQTSVIYNLFPF